MHTRDRRPSSRCLDDVRPGQCASCADKPKRDRRVRLLSSKELNVRSRQ